MAPNQDLFVDKTPEIWKKTLACYDQVLKAKANTKSKPAAKKELVELDNWYQNDLPGILKDRKYMNKGELEKLMKWKLARGKFRPTLQGLIASNKEEDVEKHSKAAFQKMPDLTAAINNLTLLRGVGPATASAILAAYDDENAPFMADESVLGIPGMGVIKYDLPCYTRFAEAVKQKTAQLKEADADFEWTAHKVELAIWTFVMAHQLDKSLIEGVSNQMKDNKGKENKRGKRKSDVPEEDVAKKVKT